MKDTSDLDLLREFAEHRGEAPFAELVRRHLPLVHSAALRLVLDAHLAEDVSQAVFTALAQQACVVSAKLLQGAPLSGWLHLTTRNVAVKTIRAESRRRAREQSALAMQADQTSEATWAEIAPHLDHALEELPDADRHALLLRFFEGRTAREIGNQLGLSEDAAQKRIGRALEKLRGQFSLRGISVSAAGMIALLGTHTVQGAPPALASGITASALASCATGAVPPLSAWLSSFTTAVTMTKTQTALVATFLLATSVPLVLQQSDLNNAHAALPTHAAPPGIPLRQRVESDASKAASEAEEIGRLRTEMAALQARLQALRTAAPTPGHGERAAGPVRLTLGRAVPLEELVYAGSTTPEAAAQSFFALQREGDVEGALGLMLAPPHQQDQQALAIPEQREQMKSAMQAEVQPIARVELLEQRPISERRTQLLFREFRTDRIVTNTLYFGQTQRGWRITL